MLRNPQADGLCGGQEMRASCRALSLLLSNAELVSTTNWGHNPHSWWRAVKAAARSC